MLFTILPPRKFIIVSIILKRLVYLSEKCVYDLHIGCLTNASDVTLISNK